MNAKLQKSQNNIAPVAKRVPGQRGEVTDGAYQHLFRLAHELGPNAKLPPVRDLRERFGVSQTTLDAALHRLERQNILTRRERSGVYVASGLRNRNICLLYDPPYSLDFGDSPFWAELFKRVRKRAHEDDIQLTTAFVNVPLDDSQPLKEPESLIPDWLRDDIEAGKVHGVLTIGVPQSTAAWIESKRVPVVAYAGAAQHIVIYAYSTLIQMGVSTLIQQGCRRIAYWRYPVRTEQHASMDFLDATFIGALAAHGMTLEDNGIIDNLRADTSVELGWDLGLRQFGPDSAPETRPDGLLIRSDMIAQGGLAALQRLGVSIGEEVRVATHFNKGFSVLRAWEDRIWRLEFDLDELVDFMFETISALIENSMEDNSHLRFDLPEGYTGPVKEKFRLIHPRLVPPAASLLISSS